MKISREEFKDFMVTFFETSDMSLRAAEFIDKGFIERVAISPVFWFAGKQNFVFCYSDKRLERFGFSL